MTKSQIFDRCRPLGVSCCLLLVLAVAACGGGPGGTPKPADTSAGQGPSGAPAVDPALVAALPKSVAAAGVIEVGTSATYEPMIFREQKSGPIVGFDVELFDTVAAKFGMKTHWTSVDFGALLTGITNDKFDVGASSITVTPDRTTTMKMVSYLDTGARWAVTGTNPLQVDPAKACGLSIGVTSGSKYQTEDLPARNKSCPAGQKIKIVGFKGADDGMSAVKFGRVDAMVADDAVISYEVAHSGGTMELVGDLYDRSQLGYAMPESEESFAAAVAKALQSLKDDGTYAKILSRWGLSNSGVTEFTVSK